MVVNEPVDHFLANLDFVNLVALIPQKNELGVQSKAVAVIGRSIGGVKAVLFDIEELIHPAGQIFKGLVGGQIKDHPDALSASIENFVHILISFLTGCVPNLEQHIVVQLVSKYELILFKLVLLDLFVSHVKADSSLQFIHVLVHESPNDACFANISISQQYNLEFDVLAGLLAKD